MLATIVSGVIVGSALIYLAYIINPSPEIYPTTYLICILGYILGWIVAIISTPMNQKDEDGLGKFSKIVGTFLSGYLLSKFDKVLEKILEPNQVLTTLIGTRLLLFGCCFGITFIIVFYYRSYKWKYEQ